MKRFLITGGTGFIGTALTKRLGEQHGYASVQSYGRKHYNLTREDDVRTMLRGSLPLDYIIHLADVVPNWSGEHAHEHSLQQMAMTLHMLEFWRAEQPQARFVTVGSLWSYPAALTVCREEDYWSGPLHPLTASYGHGKKLMTVGIETLKRQYGMQGTTLVLGSVYGPGDRSQHVIPTLMRKMRKNPDYLELQTDGYEERQFTYIDDQVERILKYLDYDGEVLNIASWYSNTVRDVVRELSAHWGYTGHVQYGPPSDLPSRRLVVDKAGVYGRTLREGLLASLRHAAVTQ